MECGSVKGSAIADRCETLTGHDCGLCEMGATKRDCVCVPDYVLGLPSGMQTI